MIKIKKLRKINETEKRTDIILDDPKFRNWFKGSKVVDSNGKPLVCFHGSTNVFDKFYPLSHFGTISAASEFAKNNITPVYLSIKNPLKYVDEGGESDALAVELFDQDLITLKEFKEIYAEFDGLIDAINEEMGMDIDPDNAESVKSVIDFLSTTMKMNKEKLVSILAKKGYDGLYYINQMEDKGSISWVILYPNQVWPIFKNLED